VTGGRAADEQGRRLALAADLTWRARRAAGAADDLPALARRLAAVAPAVERAHRVRFDPPYPGAGGAVEDVRGGRRLVLVCRALGAGGAVEAVVFTTLIEGRAPLVSVAPPEATVSGGGLQPRARGVPARQSEPTRGGPWRPR
jgi:hypothetical protein